MGRNVKLIVGGILSLALLLACAVTPELLHSPAGEPGGTGKPGGAGEPSSLTLSQRASYYALYQAKKLTAQREYDMSASVKALAVVSAVKDGFQIDSVGMVSLIDEGVKYYTLDCGEDGAIHLMEYSREWNALWHNWFIITVDADTGDIYHFYASSGILKTLDSFQNVNGVPETLGELFTAFTAITGLNTVGPYTKTGDTSYTQAFSDGESTVTYAINRFNYIAARMMDVEMTMQGETPSPAA